MENLITALGPNDPDDGDAGRQQRGIAIAAIAPIKPDRFGYKVPSMSGNGSYLVNLEYGPYCTCPDFEANEKPCKHVYAVQVVLQREQDGRPSRPSRRGRCGSRSRGEPTTPPR